MSIGGEYLKTVIKRFTDAKITAEKALEQLSESELFWSPNEESNSIAIVIMNLWEILKRKNRLWNCGNLVGIPF
jgi:hypothetical protein